MVSVLGYSLEAAKELLSREGITSITVVPASPPRGDGIEGTWEYRVVRENVMASGVELVVVKRPHRLWEDGRSVF